MGHLLLLTLPWKCLHPHQLLGQSQMRKWISLRPVFRGGGVKLNRIYKVGALNLLATPCFPWLLEARHSGYLFPYCCAAPGGCDFCAYLALWAWSCGIIPPQNVYQLHSRNHGALRWDEAVYVPPLPSLLLLSSLFEAGSQNWPEFTWSMYFRAAAHLNLFKCKDCNW